MRDNPIVVLGIFLGVALVAWLGVYSYVFIYLPHQKVAEEAAAAKAYVAESTGAADESPIRIAYQPMPWPDLKPGGGRLELQVQIVPYDADNADLLCKRIPQVKDVINLVLSQFDKESVALKLDLAVVEEQLTNAINKRLGDRVIRGAFIDLGTTTGTFERYRLYCRASGEGASGVSGSAIGSRSLDNWLERAAKSRQRRAERLRLEREQSQSGQ